MAFWLLDIPNPSILKLNQDLFKAGRKLNYFHTVSGKDQVLPQHFVSKGTKG